MRCNITGNITCNIIVRGGEMMRIINSDNLLQEIEYINSHLRKKKRGFRKIALEDYGREDQDITEQLKGFGYTKIKNQFVAEECNIEVIYPTRQIDITEVESVTGYSENDITEHITSEENSNMSLDILNRVDMQKFTKLLNNIDDILELIPKRDGNSVIYRSGKNEVRSIRIDTGLYEELKNRAAEQGVTATELFNKALEEYLKTNR